MARSKTKQTTVEKQHGKVLKKRGVKLADWEEEAFKKAIGDIAAKDDEVFEDVLDLYRKKEVEAEINAFLNSDDKGSSKTKEKERFNSDVANTESKESKY